MIGKYLDLIPGSLRQLVQLNGKETETEKGCETLFVKKNFQEGEREDRKYVQRKLQKVKEYVMSVRLMF